MPLSRIHLVATVAVCLVWAAPAGADDVLVLGGGTRSEPAVEAIDRTPVPPHSAVRQAPPPTALAAKRTTALTVLRDLYGRGQLEQERYRAYRDEYQRSKAFMRTLEGAREIAMRGVLTNLDQIAARGQLKESRLNALFTILERNREWWSSGPLLIPGQRVEFPGSQLVFEYVSGEGLQFHPLANFGKLNYLCRTRAQRGNMTKMLGELLPLAAFRSGGRAWEYYYDFGGGAPPWVSSLSQGTALQSLSCAATKAGVGADVLPDLAQGLKIFQRRTPQGVRVPVAGPGDHYAQYSFAPDLRILNGFVQSLNGLYDFSTLASNETAATLFQNGLARVRREIPTYDTGAWSLYARGTSQSESSLNYHVLLRDFLTTLCDRTSDDVACTAEDHFTRYLDEEPQLQVLTHNLRAKRAGAVRFRVSKISTVTLSLARGGSTVFSRTATLGYGKHSYAITPPKGARGYDVTLSATDLAGNAGSATGAIQIRRK